MFNNFSNEKDTPEIREINWNDPSSIVFCLFEQNRIVTGGDRILLIRYLNEHLNEVGSLLFNAARNAKGGRKSVYARALSNLEPTVGVEKYETLLEHLMTNREAIEELVHTGREEEKGLSDL